MLFKSEWCGCVENNKYILASRIMKHLAKYSHQDYCICSKRSLFSLHLPQLLGRGALFPQEYVLKKNTWELRLWGNNSNQQMPGSPSQYHEFNGVLNQKKHLKLILVGIWFIDNSSKLWFQWSAWDYKGLCCIFRDGWRHVPSIYIFLLQIG